MKLIILAAGRGLRFLPITSTMPKGMIPLLGEPLLKHVVTPYLPHVSEIIFVVNSGMGMQIKEYFGENYLGHAVTYKIQPEQRGTMDALMVCKDLINSDELFCVCTGDDLLTEAEIKNAITPKVIGLGISKKLMPKNYLGIKIEGGYVSGFERHDEEKVNTIEDLFWNGFSILDKKVFDFEPVRAKNGELGLPHTLFDNLNTYPLRAFEFQKWDTVNGPDDVAGAEEFLKNLL